MVQFIPLILFPQIFLSGVIWPVEQMPDYLQWLSAILPLRYAVDGLRDIMLAGKSLLDVGPSVPGSKLVDIIEEALDRVSTLRGRLGSIQKNIIDTNIATLGVALENITEARSQILDTDFASETAQLTRSQILVQSGIAVLGIANQNPSQVLSLLG